jgi:hypothetical protein
MTHSSGVEGSTSRLTGFPFTEKPIIANSPILFRLQAVRLNGSTAKFYIVKWTQPETDADFSSSADSISESAPDLF